MEAKNRFYATGRRKSATARVYLSPGTGKITVNDREFNEYFMRDVLTNIACQPLDALKVREKFDVDARLDGGGLAGQAGALRLGIARALVELDPKNKEVLKEGGFLTRDSRIHERKKYGRKGARRRYQFSKR